MKLLVTLLISTIALISSAETRTEDVLIVKKPSPGIYEDSSEHRRIGKSVIVTAQTLGLGPVLWNSQGLTAGYFLNRNLILQMEVMRGDLRLHGLNDKEVKMQSIGAHFKHFLANSFYYRIGVDHLKVQTDQMVYGRTTSYPFSGPGVVTSESLGQFEGTMTGATLTIGNQWQWENFTLGCDWVGITSPITSQISFETANDSTAQSRLEDDENFLVKSSKLHLLRFYLGASF